MQGGHEAVSGSHFAERGRHLIDPVTLAGEVAAGIGDGGLIIGMPVDEGLVVTALATVDEQEHMIGLERRGHASCLVTLARGVAPFLMPFSIVLFQVK